MIIVVCFKAFLIKPTKWRITVKLKNILIELGAPLFSQQNIPVPQESDGAVFRVLRNSPPERVICELDPPAIFRLDRGQPIVRVVAVTNYRSGAPLLDQVADFVI